MKFIIWVTMTYESGSKTANGFIAPYTSGTSPILVDHPYSAEEFTLAEVQAATAKMSKGQYVTEYVILTKVD